MDGINLPLQGITAQFQLERELTFTAVIHTQTQCSLSQNGVKGHLAKNTRQLKNKKPEGSSVKNRAYDSMQQNITNSQKTNKSCDISQNEPKETDLAPKQNVSEINELFVLTANCNCEAMANTSYIEAHTCVSRNVPRNDMDAIKKTVSGYDETDKRFLPVINDKYDIPIIISPDLSEDENQKNLRKPLKKWNIEEKGSLNLQSHRSGSDGHLNKSASSSDDRLSHSLTQSQFSEFSTQRQKSFLKLCEQANAKRKFPGAFSASKEDNSSIILPARFRRRRSRTSSLCTCEEEADENQNNLDENVNTCVNSEIVSKCDSCLIQRKSDCDKRIPHTKNGDKEENLATMTKDINTALLWIRSEIHKMKSQDKVLMRQFLDLRSTIHRFNTRERAYTTSSCSSCTDSRDGSSMSLDETYDSRHGSRPGSLLKGEEHLVEFRPRTVSMLTPREKTKLSVCRRSSKDTDDL